MSQLRRLLCHPLCWFLVALTLRLLYLQESSGSFQFYQQMLDEQEVAHTAATGFGEQPLFKAPLYPLLLKVMMAVSGNGWIYTTRLLQHLLGALLILVLYDTTFRLSRSRAAAALAAAIGAFYGPMIRLEDRLILDFLVLFLQSTMLWALIRSVDAQKPLRWFLLASGLAGLSWLNRPTLMPVLPFIALWVVLVPPRSWKRGLLFLSIPVLAMLVVGLRNQLVGREFMTNPWQGGYNFYFGNNADANGRYMRQMSFDVSATGNPTEVRMVEGYKEAHADDPDFAFTYKGLNHYWYDLGKQAIVADPLRWLGLMVRKAFYLVSAREIYNFEDYNIQRSMSRWLKVGLGGFGLVWPLAVASLAFVRKQGAGRSQALLWLYTLLLGGAIALFFCSGRLRMPLMFPVTVLAAVGVCELWRSRKYTLYLGLLCVGAAMSWGDWWGVRSEDVGYVEYARLSNAAWHAGEYQVALDLAEQAATSKKDYPVLPILRGQALYSLGRIDEAIKNFDRAMLYLKRDPIPPYNLGRIYFCERNDIKKAIYFFAYARELGYARATPMLARAELKKGNPAQAHVLMQPVLQNGLEGVDIQSLITAIFMFEQAGNTELVGSASQLLLSRFGDEGAKIFESEIRYFKQP